MARAVARAVVGANSALASDTSVTNVALALAGGLVASTATRALLLLVCGVCITKIKVAAIIVGKSKGVVVIKVNLAVSLEEGLSALKGALKEDVKKC